MDIWQADMPAFQMSIAPLLQRYYSHKYQKQLNCSTFFCPEYPISTLIFSTVCSLFIIPDINTITIYYEHILVKNHDDNLLILRRIFKALQIGRNWSAKWARLMSNFGEFGLQKDMK